MKSSDKIRVLIAEDHLITRIGVSTIVNTQRDMAVVGEAINGHQAVAQYRTLRPDIVLMDMLMPVMDGFDAVTTICSEFPEARVLALSTHGGDEDIHRAFVAGVRAYLTKDVLHDELIQAIHTVHGGDRYISAPIAAILNAQNIRADLSAREIEVLRLIAGGRSNKEIAGSLGISDQTVKSHVKSIFAKLGVDDRTQAATTAIQRGVIHLQN